MCVKIKTRFLLLSDTHSTAAKPAKYTDYAFRQPLPGADVAIHSGDLTGTGKIEEHKTTIALLKSIKAELKIVIPGNHDLTLDTEYYPRKGHVWGPRPKYTNLQLQEIRDLYTGSEAKACGIHYMEEGISTFNLKSGARLTVYASAYTPEFCGWAFAYPHWQDRFNSSSATNPIPSYNTNTNTNHSTDKNLDVIITHGPPHTILDLTTRDEHVGCPHLLDAVSRSRPLLHCFGHIHEGWGATKKSWPTTTSSNPTPLPSSKDNSNNTISATSNQKIINLKKQQQLDQWSQTYTWEETQITVDKEKTVKEKAAYVDGTNLKRGEETLFVNASIMDYQYRPVQGPWLVDLMLDKIEQV